MEPPGAPPHLITIPISHYCEKARWALERAGIHYVEERHVQGIHRLAARRAGGGDTVPVLVAAEGSIGESREILAWVDERTPPGKRLYPDDPALQAEVVRVSARFDEVLGPRARRLIYVHVLSEPETMLAFNNAGVPRWEDRFMRMGWPLARRWVERGLGIRPGGEIRDEQIVWEELDFAASLLADGRPHLCGDRFTAADLTFAALSAAVIAPPRYGVPLPQPEQMKPETADLVRRARAHPAGAYAMRLFAERT